MHYHLPSQPIPPQAFEMAVMIVWKGPGGGLCGGLNASATRARRYANRYVFAIPLLLLGGCVSLGPQRLGIDRSDYADHLRETNKEQLLLNIVALRYGDAPLFLEVTSVISQYTREGSVRADVELSPPPDDAFGLVGGAILLRETPTVTYTPLAGDRFAQSLLAPIEPAALLGMIESGWSADILFRLVVRSINGVRNDARDPMFALRGDPEFEDTIQAMGRLQRSGALTIRVRRTEDSKFEAVAHMRKAASDTDKADAQYLSQALNLPGGNGQMDLAVTFADAQNAPNQLAIGTRSMFQIFSEMAQGVEGPAVDAAGEEAGQGDASPSRNPLLRIHSGDRKPDDAYAAVRYRKLWFWIDGKDARSKQNFMIAQILLSLNSAKSSGSSPIVTIPTG